ncbi:MAG TPA: YciI family protein [Aliiroseovarius sp.]|nr:YciI family protein [Aliiroseovarius sp.]
MLAAVICTDKKGALDVRLANRDAHLAYIASTGIVVQAGPFLDANGDMCGSLVILDVETLAEAESWAAADPYAQAGLFSDVRIEIWKKVVG